MMSIQEAFDTVLAIVPEPFTRGDLHLQMVKVRPRTGDSKVREMVRRYLQENKLVLVEGTKQSSIAPERFRRVQEGSSMISVAEAVSQALESMSEPFTRAGLYQEVLKIRKFSPTAIRSEVRILVGRGKLVAVGGVPHSTTDPEFFQKKSEAKHAFDRRVVSTPPTSDAQAVVERAEDALASPTSSDASPSTPTPPSTEGGWMTTGQVSQLLGFRSASGSLRILREKGIEFRTETSSRGMPRYLWRASAVHAIAPLPRRGGLGKPRVKRRSTSSDASLVDRLNGVLSLPDDQPTEQDGAALLGRIRALFRAHPEVVEIHANVLTGEVIFKHFATQTRNIKLVESDKA